ncbi:hypothetical protein JL722_8171 [Aureococcus anophagefferens]|nr:hypothetical protein JL722_8171 [Aureococcus anophagefferens]
MDDSALFEASFGAGRKQIFVDVKENDFGTYCKIKERGANQNNSILIPSESIVKLRDALNEAISTLGLKEGKGSGGGGAAAAPRVEKNPCAVHVGNLSWDTTDEALYELFARVGDVQSATVQMNRSGRSQGWGLVEFAGDWEVEAAISQCDGAELDGREIRVRADKGSKVAPAPAAKKAAAPIEERDKVPEPCKVFVMNLSSDTSAAGLKAHCGGVGEVVDVELLTRGKNNRPSGSAILTYAYEESAAAAIQALEGTELDGRDLRVRAYYLN